MDKVAGGKLAAAVSQAGGLGLIGGGYGDAAWLERAFASSPYGVDFRILRSSLFEPVADHARFNSTVARIERDVWRRTRTEWDRATERALRN